MNTFVNDKKFKSFDKAMEHIHKLTDEKLENRPKGKTVTVEVNRVNPKNPQVRGIFIETKFGLEDKKVRQEK